MKTEQKSSSRITLFFQKNTKWLIIIALLVVLNIFLVIVLLRSKLSYSYFNIKKEKEMDKKAKHIKDEKDEKDEGKGVVPLEKYPNFINEILEKGKCIWDTSKFILKVDNDLELITRVAMCRSNIDVVPLEAIYFDVFLSFSTAKKSIEILKIIPINLENPEDIFRCVPDLPSLYFNNFRIKIESIWDKNDQQSLTSSGLECYTLMLNSCQNSYKFFGPCFLDSVFFENRYEDNNIIYFFYNLLSYEKIMNENKVRNIKDLMWLDYFTFKKKHLECIEFIKTELEKYDTLFFLIHPQNILTSYYVIEFNKKEITCCEFMNSKIVTEPLDKADIDMMHKIFYYIFNKEFFKKSKMINLDKFHAESITLGIACYLKSCASKKLPELKTSNASLKAKIFHEMLTNRIIYN
ncbi:hypothetical protein NUSPORA_00404 [Nucleospora cyclopteri]